MTNFVIKLDDLKLVETGSASEDATSNVIVFTILYPNFLKSESAATIKASLKDDLALSQDEKWVKNVEINPTHNWFYKGSVEGSGVIKVQVLNAKTPGVADKISAAIIKAAIDGALSIIPLGSLLKKGVTGGIDKLEFEPKESKHIVAEGLIQFQHNAESGELTFISADGTATNQLNLISPATVTAPVRKMHQGAFIGWDKEVLIEKNAPNGFLRFGIEKF